MIQKLCPKCECNYFIERNPHLKPETIMKEISNYLDIPVGWIISNKRNKDICEARFMICDILYRYFKLSLKQIGILLGNRDHTSVLHALRKIEIYCMDEIFNERYRNVHKFTFGHDRFFRYTEDFYHKKKLVVLK